MWFEHHKTYSNHCWLQSQQDYKLRKTSNRVYKAERGPLNPKQTGMHHWWAVKYGRVPAQRKQWGEGLAYSCLGLLTLAVQTIYNKGYLLTVF